MRLYLDANAIVFAVEGPDALREFVTSWTARAESAPEGAVLTSRLSVSECLTRPYREKDETRIANMKAFFRTRVQMLSVDDALVEMATELHRDFSLKTIDALHVASALRANAAVFLTRDTGINRYPSLRGLRCEAIPS